MNTSIKDIKNNRLRIWILHPNDPSFTWFHDLGLGYLLTLLVDLLGFNIYRIAVNYVFFSNRSVEKIKSELSEYSEEYFLFFLENFFHSADYAIGFLNAVLTEMEERGIQKKVIVFSHKTPTVEAMECMKKYKNIVVFVHDDIEYFFYALFHEDKNLSEIPNLLFRDESTGDICSSREESTVDYDIGKYIIGAYHSGHYAKFPKSRDDTIDSLDEDTASNSIHFEMNLPKEILKEVIRSRQEGVMLSTGRGCKYKCAYCYRGAKYSNIRQIPLDVIEKDLKYLQSKGYKQVLWYDDCFLTTNLGRLEEVVDLMNKYDFTYDISVRFEVCSEKNLEILTRAKIGSIQIGLQSVSRAANKESKRGFHEDSFGRVIQAIRMRGIRVSIDTILGLPGDTPSGFISTIRYALLLSPTAIVTNTLYLNPRTELYEKKDYYHIKTREQKGYSRFFKAPVIESSDTFSAQEIQFCKKFLIQCKEKFTNTHFVIR